MTSAEFLQRLIETNLAAAAAIVVVMAIRRPARRIIGPGAAYALWLTVPLAALAVLAPSPWKQVVETAAVGVAPAFAEPGPAIASTPVTTTDPNIWIIAGWALGAVLMFSLFALAQRKLGADPGRPQTTTAGFGPAVVGALFPRVVLPADFETRYTPPERDVILAHEQAHLRAGHAQINGLVALAQCLAWFNPLVHLGAWLMRIDQELACDAAVLARRPEVKRLYAETLLKTQTTNRPLPFGCYWPANGVGPLKERILMMKRPSPTFARRIGGALAATGMVLATGLAAWAAQPARVEFVAPTDAEPAPAPKDEASVEATGADQQIELALNGTAEAVPAGRTEALREPATQTPPRRPSVITAPQWIERPTGADMAEFYPERLRQDGAALVSCTATAEGRLSGCSVTAERPEGFGVGDAALALAAKFRMQPQTREGAPVEGARVNVPFQFSLQPEQSAATYITRPDWTQQPNGERWGRLTGLIGEGQAEMVLDCQVDADGGLTGCFVPAARPEGIGLEEALLELAPYYRMQPVRADGSSVAGARVRLPFVFDLRADRAAGVTSLIPDESPVDLSEDDMANLRLVFRSSSQRRAPSSAAINRSPPLPSDVPPEIMLEPDAG